MFLSYGYTQGVHIGDAMILTAMLCRIKKKQEYRYCDCLLDKKKDSLQAFSLDFEIISKETSYLILV